MLVLIRGRLKLRKTRCPRTLELFISTFRAKIRAESLRLVINLTRVTSWTSRLETVFDLF